MEKEASDEVRELMEYEEDTVGSLMSSEFICFQSDFSAEQTINSLRELKPEEDMIYYIYVINRKNKLIGTVSLRDLIIAAPGEHLKNIMRKGFIFIYDTDNIDELVNSVSKYNLLSIPVVDKDMVLVGNVVASDVIDELIE
jgi:Mg/Co/Ni transporter MgtE